MTNDLDGLYMTLTLVIFAHEMTIKTSWTRPVICILFGRESTASFVLNVYFSRPSSALLAAKQHAGSIAGRFADVSVAASAAAVSGNAGSPAPQPHPQLLGDGERRLSPQRALAPGLQIPTCQLPAAASSVGHVGAQSTAKVVERPAPQAARRRSSQSFPVWISRSAAHFKGSRFYF